MLSFDNAIKVEINLKTTKKFDKIIIKTSIKLYKFYFILNNLYTLINKKL